MDTCTECGAIEQGFEEDDDGVETCKCCGMEDSRKSYDEDAGKDR
jgi:hypothetical protein